MSQTYFLTGALGCIGAWVTKTVLDQGDSPVVFDMGGDPRRLKDILSGEELARVKFVQGDITDLDLVTKTMEETHANKIIHLAGLQVPFCKADPSLGARVNVVGTVNLFEAAKRTGVERVVYASSAAVYGKDDLGAGGAAPDEDVACHPGNHYGVFKAANEGNARIFWQDDSISSVGLRPLTVYGVGRDQGLTSGPTRAMKAAVLGREFTIPFSGATDFNYVADTAATFVASADRAPEGAHVYNLHGASVEVARIVEVIESLAPEAGRIQVDGPEIPIPPALDGRALREALPDLPDTPLEEGIAMTMDRFRTLHEEGRLSTHDLES